MEGVSGKLGVMVGTEVADTHVGQVAETELSGGVGTDGTEVVLACH